MSGLSDVGLAPTVDNVTGDDPQWIPPKQAAEKLGVSTRTLLRMADTDSITVITLPSGHHRYDAHEIDRIANDTTVTGDD